ncbi:MAG: hypothetical protein PCFJNLEI_02161 [Verrucomicrobiae bacterium]|nr:hypothetical protein [Verrucomicrobiae bacterium]
MSLKIFHLIFVIIAALFCIGFGIWCFTAETARGQVVYTWVGIVSLATVVALAVFEVNFLRRMRGVR